MFSYCEAELVDEGSEAPATIVYCRSRLGKKSVCYAITEGMWAVQNDCDQSIQYVAQRQKECGRCRTIAIGQFSMSRNDRRNVGGAERLRSVNSVCHAASLPRSKYLLSRQLQIEKSGGEDAIVTSKLLHFIFAIHKGANREGRLLGGTDVASSAKP
jgi:hypothetical protein